MLQYRLSVCDGLGLMGSVSAPCPHTPASPMGMHTTACGGGGGYVNGKLKPRIIEMALGEHKEIDLTFREKKKTDAN